VTTLIRQFPHKSASCEFSCDSAGWQLKVEKQTDGENTHTQVAPLETEERVTEIARMLGGLELTANTLAHAREMVEKAASSTINGEL
jgi:DNA repair ATPase RecN